MSKEETQPQNKTLREFYESVPPDQECFISDLTGSAGIARAGVPLRRVNSPDIEIFCATEGSCNRMQMFRQVADIDILPGHNRDTFVEYKCRNCGQTSKTYAVFIALSAEGSSGVIFKYGESPQFGPPNPPRLISLLRNDKDTYLKGRRAENQGMGIGAFAYYRRVVESQKNRLLDKILEVCKLYRAPQELLEEIASAKAEKRFTSAIEVVKHALPDVLFIAGQNPLTLLHDALSEGLHAESDAECLEAATDIRVVMIALAERLAEATREEAELKQSISRLIQKKAARALKKPA